MPSRDTDEDDPGEGEVTDGYRAVLERYENEPDQCTIFPADGREQRTSKWITARSPGFVDLWEHR